MEFAKVLDAPKVRTIISLIEQNCFDTVSHRDNYDFLDSLCEVNYDGETKTVLLRDDWDFVIKVPNYYTYPSHNYCDLEVKNYASAVLYHIERILLETAVVATLENGITLYAQARYQSCTYDYFEDENNKRAIRQKLNNSHASAPSRKALEGMYDHWRISTPWFCRVVQLYGKRFARALEMWTMENKIGDLHDGNTGWYKNKPIILDYAGYYG